MHYTHFWVGVLHWEPLRLCMQRIRSLSNWQRAGFFHDSFPRSNLPLRMRKACSHVLDPSTGDALCTFLGWCSKLRNSPTLHVENKFPYSSKWRRAASFIFFPRSNGGHFYIAIYGLGETHETWWIVWIGLSRHTRHNESYESGLARHTRHDKSYESGLARHARLMNRVNRVWRDMRD